MQKTILVCAAIIQSENKILICQRPKDSKAGSLKWEFPGGKIEFGESPQDALFREINEELGVNISISNLFSVSSHVYQNQTHVILITYLCKIVSGEIQKREIADFKWAEKSLLPSFDFLSADLPIIQKILRELP